MRSTSVKYSKEIEPARGDLRHRHLCYCLHVFLPFLFIPLGIIFRFPAFFWCCRTLCVGTPSSAGPPSTAHHSPFTFLIRVALLPCRRMSLTECSLLNRERGPIDINLSHRFYLHKQASPLSTGDVKCSITVGLVALNRCAMAFLLAQVAGQLPACRWNVANPFNRF